MPLLVVFHYDFATDFAFGAAAVALDCVRDNVGAGNGLLAIGTLNVLRFVGAIPRSRSELGTVVPAHREPGETV